MVFFEQYQRHYCYRCQRYAPEGYGAHGAGRCPTCGGILSYVSQYDRFYCFRCNAYAPTQPQPALVPTLEAPAPTPTASETPSGERAEGRPPEGAIRPEAPTPEPAEAPEGPAPSMEGVPHEAAEVTPEKTPPEEDWTVQEKPPLLREEILAAKKSRLVDLCKVYDLDPTGTKEQLQERLLSYLGDLEGEERPEQETPAAEEAVPQTPPAVEAAAVVEPNAPVAQALTVEEPTEKPAEPEPAPEKARQPEIEVPETTAPAETPSVVPEAHAEAPRAEHPCPSCGRELSYVSQYDRWYCYSCQRYAPAIQPKNACPNCGATLRWIERYERWWCDACQRYAPADLPRPRAATAVSAASAATQAATQARTKPAAAAVHKHHSPTSGIGLLGLGLALYVVYAVFVEFPTMFAMPVTLSLAPDVASTLRFFAFLFVAAGAMAGLWALRDRT